MTKKDKAMLEVVTNIWGSWDQLKKLTNQDMRELVRRGLEEEIGTMQFKKALIGDIDVGSNFKYALQAINIAINEIKKENKEPTVKEAQKKVVTKRMITDARKQELREIRRTGGKEIYDKIIFK